MAFRSNNHDSSSRPGRNAPADDTHEEAAYLKMLGEKQRPVSIKLLDGSVVRGWIEYYDRRMVRLTRDSAANLFIFKHQIAYIADETGRALRPTGEENGNAVSASE